MSYVRPPTRDPKWGFNRTLRSQHGHVGCVTRIYANLQSAVNAHAVCDRWFDQQDIPPSTKDQIFYGCVALDGVGAFLVGELDAKEA